METNGSAGASHHRIEEEEARRSMTARAMVKQKPSSVAPMWSVRQTDILRRECACGGSAGMNTSCAECQQKKPLGETLQTKLRIDEPADRYEQEADRIADGIMGSANHSPTEEVSQQVQRFGPDQTGSATAPAIVDDVLSSAGQPLDASTRAFFEPRFGHDFSRVRVHSDAMAEQSARDVNAHAYTVGHDIVFGAGRFSPGTQDGRRFLAHELTHVLQQGDTEKDGRSIQPLTMQRQSARSGPKPAITESEGCDPALQSDLKAMHQPALDHVDRAIASLGPGWKGMIPADKAAFSQFFDPSNSGQIDNGFVRTVREKYRFIRSNMRSLRFDCDLRSWTLCGTSKRWCVGGRLMWTCFGNLHVCSNAYKTATPSHKIETIIHESVHNALLTTDRAYSNEQGFRELSPRGTGFWGRVLNFLSNIPVLGILFRLLPWNKDTMNNPDSYAGYAMQV